MSRWRRERDRNWYIDQELRLFIKNSSTQRHDLYFHLIPSPNFSSFPPRLSLSRRKTCPTKCNWDLTRCSKLGLIDVMQVMFRYRLLQHPTVSSKTVLKPLLEPCSAILRAIGALRATNTYLVFKRTYLEYLPVVQTTALLISLQGISARRA